MKSFGFTQIKEGIGSTHRGIVETYTTSFRVNSTSSKVEYGYQSRGYKLSKASYIRERTSRGFCTRRTVSDDISTKDPTVHSEADVSISTQPEEETMRKHWIIEATG